MSRIPPQAKCVFKGVIFDVYQWEQELYDGTTTTFEMLKRPDTVMVLALQGDRIFYAQQEQPNKPPYLSLFGGRADDDENPLDTAKRELLEETGMTSDTWHLLRAHPYKGKIDWAVYFFVARNCIKTAEPHFDGGEKITVQSCSLDDFINTIIPDKNFADRELRAEILSAFNPDAIATLKNDILHPPK